MNNFWNSMTCINISNICIYFVGKNGNRRLYQLLQIDAINKSSEFYCHFLKEEDPSWNLREGFKKKKSIM